MLAADDSDSDLSELNPCSKFAHAYTMWVSLFHFFGKPWQEARFHRMPMLAQPSALCRSVTLAAWKPVDLNMSWLAIAGGEAGRILQPRLSGTRVGTLACLPHFFLKDQNLWDFVWKPAPLQVVQFCSRKKVKLETCVFWHAKIYKGWA